MSDRPEPDPSRPTELFGEYLRRRGDGEDVDVEDLLRRGRGSRELRRKIELYEALERMGSTWAGPGDSPEHLGRFEILARIGAGGAGRVYLARDPKLGRRVALKELDGGIGTGRDERRWVLNEARSLARLEHPGVVRVLEVAEAGRKHFLVMEHLTGPSLAEVIGELVRLRGPSAGIPDEERGDGTEPEALAWARRLQPYSERVRLFRDLVRALAYCHDMGVVHRDVKPSNVILDGDGRPKLIDFGLAHVPDDADGQGEEGGIGITQRLVGTPAYVAPEQVESGRTGRDPRSDQFSLGIVGYELFTLTNPFHRDTRSRTMDAIGRATPPTPRRVEPAIPADVEQVLLFALERDPSERYVDLAALAADLDAILEHRPISATELSIGRVLRLWLRRNRRWIAALATVLGLALLALVLLGAAGALGERNRIATELAATERDATPDADGFRARFGAMGRLRRDVERFEGGFFARLLPGSLRELFDATARRASRELRETIDSEIARQERAGVDFQRDAWRHAVEMEEVVCPECPDNRDLRDLGRVFLPRGELEGLQLTCLQQVLTGARLPVHRPTTFVELPVPGVYRLLAWEAATGSIVWEVEFLQTSHWDPPKRLELRRPEPSVLTACRWIPSTSIPIVEREPSGADVEIGSLQVPSFRIQTDLVTRARFRAFLEATGTEVDERFQSGEADPRSAPTTHAEASAYATWLGGRLPTSVEVHLLLGDSPPLPPDATAEWVSDLSARADVAMSWAFNYSFPAEGPLGTFGSRTEGFVRGDWVDSIGFRVAFSADRIDAVLAAGAHGQQEDR